MFKSASQSVIRKILLAAIATIACNSVIASKADDTFNVAFDAGPATLDAYKEADRPGLSLIRMVYSGLIQKTLKQVNSSRLWRPATNLSMTKRWNSRCAKT